MALFECETDTVNHPPVLDDLAVKFCDWNYVRSFSLTWYSHWKCRYIYRHSGGFDWSHLILKCHSNFKKLNKYIRKRSNFKQIHFYCISVIIHVIHSIYHSDRITYICQWRFFTNMGYLRITHGWIIITLMFCWMWVPTHVLTSTKAYLKLRRRWRHGIGV